MKSEVIQTECLQVTTGMTPIHAALFKEVNGVLVFLVTRHYLFSFFYTLSITTLYSFNLVITGIDSDDET